MRVIENQGKKKIREYNIVGPRRDTVESFWRYLLLMPDNNVTGFTVEHDGVSTGLELVEELM